jgi:hypothetical protein
MTRPPTTVASASTEPTERSMPPSRMTKVMPTAMTVLMEICVRMLVRLPSEAKCGARTEKSSTMSASARPMPASRSIR